MAELVSDALKSSYLKLLFLASNFSGRVYCRRAEAPQFPTRILLVCDRPPETKQRGAGRGAVSIHIHVNYRHAVGSTAWLVPGRAGPGRVLGAAAELQPGGILNSQPAARHGPARYPLRTKF